MVRFSSLATWGITAAAFSLLSACALIVGLNDALPRSDAVDSADSATTDDAGADCPKGDRLCFSGSVCEPFNSPEFGCGDRDCNQCQPPHTSSASTECVGQAGTLACNITSCDALWKDCNNRSDDGCEVDTSQGANCLGCTDGGCPADASLCTHAGGVAACTADCAPLTQCDTACVDERSDPAHCGSCNNSCPEPRNSTSECLDGGCSFTCFAGSHFCAGAPPTCEQDQDPQHCGKDCVACAQEQNSIPTCASGSCALKCNLGYADCKVGAGDGCETNVYNDPNNCGICGKVCGGTVGCCNGNCQASKCLEQQIPDDQPAQPVQ